MMRRTVRPILAGLSLLICVIVCWLWIRSMSTTDAIDRTRPAESRDSILSLYSWRGSIILERRAEAPATWNRKYAGWERRSFPAAHTWTSEYLRSARDAAGFHLLGFWFCPAGFIDASGLGTPVRASAWLFGIPDWAIALLAALLPLSMIRARFVQRRRISAGRCAGCGYDLRGVSGRCPECGRESIFPSA